MAGKTPIAGETWANRATNHSDASRPAEYVIVAVAVHTQAFTGPNGPAQTLVVYRAAEGQMENADVVWATPLGSFVENFQLKPKVNQ